MMGFWPGPKAAVLRHPNLSMYGLDLEMRTAVYLGEIPCEVPRMPPYDRELADVIEGALYVTSGPMRGQRFQVVQCARVSA